MQNKDTIIKQTHRTSHARQPKIYQRNSILTLKYL